MDRKANIFDRVLALLMILVMVFSQGNLAVFADVIDDLQDDPANTEVASTESGDSYSDDYDLTDEPEVKALDAEPSSNDEITGEPDDKSGDAGVSSADGLNNADGSLNPQETGDGTGNETGDGTGNETGDGTGNETGDGTGNETGDGTGNE
ncbi:MAG: hypothetical protein IJI78_08600, partial [Oscillospiraceae bacterium]|nr:hypothetical protein [Oscillospiraceae bacterium]